MKKIVLGLSLFILSAAGLATIYTFNWGFLWVFPILFAPLLLGIQKNNLGVLPAPKFYSLWVVLASLPAAFFMITVVIGDVLDIMGGGYMAMLGVGRIAIILFVLSFMIGVIRASRAKFITPLAQMTVQAVVVLAFLLTILGIDTVYYSIYLREILTADLYLLTRPLFVILSVGYILLFTLWNIYLIRNYSPNLNS